MSNIENILSEALTLEAPEKLQLIEKIMASIYPASKGVEELWSAESEERISTHKEGNLPALDEKDTFAKYKK